MKKFIFPLGVVLTLILTFALAVTVYANEVSVNANGQPIVFADQSPVIMDGRSLVPASGVFQALGFDVQWDGDTRQVTITKAGNTIIIIIGSSEFTTNGTSHSLDVPAQIINGRTMLPIATVLQSVGYNVGWDEKSQTYIITAATHTMPVSTPETALVPTYIPAPVSALESEETTSLPSPEQNGIIPRIEVDLLDTNAYRVVEGVTAVLTNVYDRIDMGKLWHSFIFAPDATITFNQNIPILITENISELPSGHTWRFASYRMFNAGVEYPISEFQREDGTWHTISIFNQRILDVDAANTRLFDTSPAVGPFISYIAFRVVDEEDLARIYDSPYYTLTTSHAGWRVPVFISIEIAYEQRGEFLARPDQRLEGLEFGLYKNGVRIDTQVYDMSAHSSRNIVFQSMEDLINNLSVHIISNPNNLLAEVIERDPGPDFDPDLDLDDRMALWLAHRTAQRVDPSNLSAITAIPLSDFYNEDGGRLYSLTLFFASN